MLTEMGNWEINWTSERSVWVAARGEQLGASGVAQLADWIAEQRKEQIRAVLPAAGGVLVEFDLRHDPIGDPWALVASLLESYGFSRDDRISASNDSEREITIPVCYAPSVGPDIESVASRLGMGMDQVVALHGERTYRVVSMGFMPGFGYLEGVDDALRLPRRETPRTRVPAGSVAIAEGMTGVYPHQSAGGWHLIGRTPERLFDPGEDTPSLLRVGDRVRFEEIALDAYRDRVEQNQDDA